LSWRSPPRLRPWFHAPATPRIGTVCNLAARLCAEAKDGQILVSSRIAEAVEAVARLEDLGNLELKGLKRNSPSLMIGNIELELDLAAL
jgi:hypothetical protein